MVYGYARCSTNDSKQDINRQKRELNALGVKREHIYFEYDSGAKSDRVQWVRLMDTVKQGDTIISTELSRITRSTKHLCEIIEQAQAKHIKLVLGSFKVDCTKDKLDAMTQGMLQMMGVFAELERNIISERVKSGMANAKAKGVKVGRPTLESSGIPSSFLKFYPQYKSKAINVTDMSRLCGMSRTTIYRYISMVESIQ